MSRSMRLVIPDRCHVISESLYVIPDSLYVIPAPDQVRGSNIRDPVRSAPIGGLQHTGFRHSPE